jgi:hypothetical protein
MSTTFEVRTDTQSRIVTCRVHGFLPDDEAEPLAASLLAAITDVRRSGAPLRLLFDNRQGAVFSAKGAEALGALKPTYDVRDRTAVLVCDSLHKLQAKRSAGRGTEVFISESAAVTWLKAWD